MATRAEQKEQRRQQILFQALELFVRKGYTDTKISDIAKASNMSMGLMFHYFESKEQLYEALVRMGAKYTNFSSEETVSSLASPLDYFSGFLTMLYQYLKEQPWIFYMFVFMAQARRNESIPAEIKAIAMDIHQVEFSAKIIEKGQKNGVFREGNPYQLSFTFWSSVQGIMEQLATTEQLPNSRADLLPPIEWLLSIIRA